MFTKRNINPLINYDLISVDQAYKDVESGKVLLVCAYESDEKFNNNALKEAIALKDFLQKKMG